MKAFLNVAKRRGSSVCSRGAAMLDAVRASVLDWKFDGNADTLALLSAQKKLRLRLSLSVAELQQQPHASIADLECAGVFRGFNVFERKGYWHVEFLICD